MATYDHLGLESDKFEPIFSPDEIGARRNFSASRTEHVSSLDKCCSFENCEKMPSIVENVRRLQSCEDIYLI